VGVFVVAFEMAVEPAVLSLELPVELAVLLACHRPLVRFGVLLLELAVTATMLALEPSMRCVVLALELPGVPIGIVISVVSVRPVERVRARTVERPGLIRIGRTRRPSTSEENGQDGNGSEREAVHHASSCLTNTGPSGSALSESRSNGGWRR
jgi:hypothetical protein